MELRVKIAAQVERFQWDNAKAENGALGVADAILAIPELAEALQTARINAMPASQFAAGLLRASPQLVPQPNAGDKEA